jgi:hypothetical protein
MTLTNAEDAIWLASLILHPLFVAYILRMRAAGRFPILFSLLTFGSAVSVGLYLLHPFYLYYFYFYWGSYPVLAILRLGVFIDVVRSIPDIRLTPRETITSFTLVAAVLTGGCIYLAIQEGSRTWQPPFIGVFLGIDRGVSILWLFLPLLAYFLLGTLGASWTERGKRIACANIVLALISLGNGYAIRIWPNFNILIDTLQTIPLCAVWGYIAWAIAGPEPAKFVLTKELRQEHQRLLNEYRF